MAGSEKTSESKGEGMIFDAHMANGLGNWLLGLGSLLSLIIIGGVAAYFALLATMFKTVCWQLGLVLMTVYIIMTIHNPPSQIDSWLADKPVSSGDAWRVMFLAAVFISVVPGVVRLLLRRTPISREEYAKPRARG